METPNSSATPEDQFEKWAKLPCNQFDLCKDSIGNYINHDTSMAWAGWIEAWMVSSNPKYLRGSESVKIGEASTEALPPDHATLVAYRRAGELGT